MECQRDLVAQKYLRYHYRSQAVGDIDPSYQMLLYLCDRFELNTEQRYWLAFAYSLSYCGASTFYVYNEFPDFEQVNLDRMQRWWSNGGREKILCQTDRRWVRSSNLFVPAVRAYMNMIGEKTQEQYFESLVSHLTSPEARYDQVYRHAERLPSYGQFSLFLLTEAIHTITPLDLMPTTLDLNAAWSCRNGLCHAYDLPYITEREVLKIPEEGKADILECWNHLCAKLQPESTVWQIETTLCAYQKWMNRKRYIGYYLDRQAVEIAKMQLRTPGVCWEVLWQYRDETYDHDYLVEKWHSLKQLGKGIPSNWKWQRCVKTRRMLEGAIE